MNLEVILSENQIEALINGETISKRTSIGHVVDIRQRRGVNGMSEYEAKAKAWDLLKLKLDGKNKSILSNPKASDEDLDFVHNNTAVLWEMGDLERSEQDE